MLRTDIYIGVWVGERELAMHGCLISYSFCIWVRDQGLVLYRAEWLVLYRAEWLVLCRVEWLVLCRVEWLVLCRIQWLVPPLTPPCAGAGDIPLPDVWSGCKSGDVCKASHWSQGRS